MLDVLKSIARRRPATRSETRLVSTGGKWALAREQPTGH